MRFFATSGSPSARCMSASAQRVWIDLKSVESRSGEPGGISLTIFSCAVSQSPESQRRFASSSDCCAGSVVGGTEPTGRMTTGSGFGRVNAQTPTAATAMTAPNTMYGRSPDPRRAPARSPMAESCWLSFTPGRKICPAPTNLNFTSPSSITSPGSMIPRRSSAVFTRTPLDEPLSTISKRPSPSE